MQRIRGWFILQSSVNSPQGVGLGRTIMTQHILQQDTVEDRQIMHRLMMTVVGFMVATGVMALVIAAVVG